MVRRVLLIRVLLIKKVNHIPATDILGGEIKQQQFKSDIAQHHKAH